jgi:hypothetical protein
MKQITLFIIITFFAIPALGQKGYYYTDNWRIYRYAHTFNKYYPFYLNIIK